jgi:hypothetical protein
MRKRRVVDTKRRLCAGLQDLENCPVAKMFGVDPMSIVNWKKNTYQPTERRLPGIVEWLGYDPRKAVAEQAPSRRGSC